MHARAHYSMYPMNKTPQADAAETAADAPAPCPEKGPRLRVRQSGVHGRGVYALRPIRAGERVMEYKGELITWKEAQRRHPHDPENPNHTFFFHVDEKHVIDGKHHGNSARWINHSCEPNCESETVGRRVFVNALRDLYPGEELFYDYGLVIDERLTPTLKREYACHCGSANCRGTMLAVRKR